MCGIAALSLLILLGCPVQAQGLLEPGTNLIPESQQASVSPESAALEAQARYGGKVLSVQLEQPPGGPPFYRVKLLSDGNVRVVIVDAQR